MQTPTIVRQTKDYLLVKIPLPKEERKSSFEPPRKRGKLSKKEERLWKIIREGEREYREGKLTPIQSLEELL